MKKIYHLTIVFLSLFLFQSCDQIYDRLVFCKRWEFTPFDLSKIKENKVGSGQLNVRPEAQNFRMNLKDYMRFDIDGTFSMLHLNNYIEGTWKREKGNIFIKTNDTSLELGILKLNDEFMSFKMIHFQTNSLAVERWQLFDEINSVFKDENSYGKFDPYLPHLNKWRINPIKVETDDEIYLRVLNHLDYLINYHDLALSPDNQGVSFRGIDTPILSTRGGVQFVDYYDLPESWKTLFYDDVDTRKAYNMVFKAFQEVPTQPKNSDFVAFNKGVLVETRYFLKQLYDQKKLF
jgi:hypothetical protein